MSINQAKKYNILFIHNFYKKPGGEDTVFNNEVRLLKEHGHNVYIYTRHNNEIDKMPIYKKIFLPFIYIFNIKSYFDIKRLIKNNNIDIVHCHNTWGLISQSIYYACVKMDVPVIQTMHNFRLICPNALFYTNKHICEDCTTKGLKCAIKNKCYRNSRLQTIISVLNVKFHRATGILKKVNFITLTEFNKEKLLLLNKIGKKKLIDEDKVFIKPNFIFYEPIKNTTNYKIKNDNGKGYYLYVGRLDEIKGVSTVLEAFSRIPDKELHVIGSDNQEYVDKYKQYTNIKFLGQLSHDEVMIEMSKGIALIFSSKIYEGMPMTIIESYKNGLPVIASDVGNAKLMIKNGKTGIHFKTGDTKSLITTIGKIENDNNLLYKNSFNEYIMKYTNNVNYEIILNIFQRIV